MITWALFVDYAKSEIRIEPAGDLGRLLSGGLSKPCRLLRGGVIFLEELLLETTDFGEDEYRSRYSLGNCRLRGRGLNKGNIVSL